MSAQTHTTSGQAWVTERVKQDDGHRRALINELNFTYERLLRRLPGIVVRLDQDPDHLVFGHQDRQDRIIGARLMAAATAYGEPPQPCTGGEADALLEEVRYAERNGSDKEERRRAVVGSLKAVRLYLHYTWGQLIAQLEGAASSSFHQEAQALQVLESGLYEALAAPGLYDAPSSTNASERLMGNSPGLEQPWIG